MRDRDGVQPASPGSRGKRRQLLRYGGWLALCALLSCDSAASNLVIAVSGLPARAVTLSVQATLEGKAAQSAMEFTQPLDRLGVALPSEASGHLALALTALDSDRCTQGTAVANADLPSQHVDPPLTATIVPKSPRQCGTLPPCAANTVCPLTSPAQKSQIFSMWSISASDIWAVGEAGTLMHFDGTTWSAVPSGVTTDLTAVWGSSATDVWAVGASNKFLHYNGTSWTPVATAAVYAMNAIWGTGANNVWAVGDNSGIGGGFGEFWHWDGAGWTRVSTGIMGALYGVWASSPADIFACGPAGLIIHFDGVLWKSKSSSTSNTLFGIWGSAPNQVFAVGQLGTVVRYDGTTWRTLPAGGVLQDLNSVFGDGKAVYIVGDTGTLLRSSATFDSFQSVTTGFSSHLYIIQPQGSNGIGWLAGSSGTGGVLAYYDNRP